MKKRLILLILVITMFLFLGGKREGPKVVLWNKSTSDFYLLSRLNGIQFQYEKGYQKVNINNQHYFGKFPNHLFSAKIESNHGLELGELIYDSTEYETFQFFYEYILLFSENGTLVSRIDDIYDAIVFQAKTYPSITISETTPISSVSLNYPTIPESYCTDSYYITNNTDELVYVVAPDYIGVPHPDAGTLEEGDSMFIPSGPLTNGLYFYRAIYPGESFYLGKEAHPDADEYSRPAAERFNEYLPLIYLVTPEMNVLYRLENFENYEFTETSDTDGKKVVLELQEEMSMRHSDYFMADF